MAESNSWSRLADAEPSRMRIADPDEDAVVQGTPPGRAAPAFPPASPRRGSPAAREEVVFRAVDRDGPSAAPARDHQAAPGQPGEEAWFSVAFSFAGPQPPMRNLWRLADVARRTRRSEAAIRAAARQGRIESVRLPERIGGRRSRIYIRATEEDLARWKIQSLEETIASRPDLPSDPKRWISIRAYARRSRIDVRTAVRRIRRRSPRRLAWGGEGPFRGEVRYWLPDLQDVKEAKSRKDGRAGTDG